MLAKVKGFSLIELLIVLVIIAVIVGIALPQYNTQVTKTRRSDGKVALLDLAARMERFYAENQTYAGATIGATGTVATSTTSPNGYYNLAITAATTTGFTLTATPVGAQLADDTLCGTLGINQLGTKTISGSGTVAQCW